FNCTSGELGLGRALVLEKSSGDCRGEDGSEIFFTTGTKSCTQLSFGIEGCVGFLSIKIVGGFLCLMCFATTLFGFAFEVSNFKFVIVATGLGPLCICFTFLCISVGFCTEILEVNFIRLTCVYVE